MRFALLLATAALLPANPALAEVVAASEQGFIVRHELTVKADALTSWAVLGQPAKYWSSSHTFSGDAANLAMDMVAGGCFCETLPPPRDQPRSSPRGSVEHLRVIYAERARMLRLSGALGPLQSEAVRGTLTISLKPADGGGTSITWEYIVGGYMRFKSEQIAPGVDAVLKQQLASLAARIDGEPEVKSGREAAASGAERRPAPTPQKP